MKKICGLNLIPQSKDALVTDLAMIEHILNLMIHILEQGIEAIKSFLNGECYKFDAQVGETLCQIRAYNFYMLTKEKKYETREEMRISLEEIRNVYNLMIKKLNEYKNIKPQLLNKNNLTIINFFKNNKIGFEVSRNTFFLICCYILTKYNVVNDDNVPVAINYKKVMIDLNVSRSLAKRIINNFQRKVSYQSCDFMFSILNELENRELQEILPLLQMKSDEGRVVLPCYEVTHIILLHILKKGGHLLVTVNNEIDKIFLLFRVENGMFQLVHSAPGDLKSKPCVVFQATTSYNGAKEEYINKIVSIGVDKIILANTASHPQYTGKKLYDLRSDPFLNIESNKMISFDSSIKSKINILRNNLKSLQSFSAIYGCCLENNKLFFIKHIFCDYIDRHLDIHQSVICKNKKINLFKISAG